MFPNYREVGDAQKEISARKHNFRNSLELARQRNISLHSWKEDGDLFSRNLENRYSSFYFKYSEKSSYDLYLGYMM